MIYPHPYSIDTDKVYKSMNVPIASTASPNNANIVRSNPTEKMIYAPT